MAIVAYTLRDGKDPVKWPPSISQCPDYFQDQGTDGHVKCVNTLNIGACGNDIEDIDFSRFKGKNLNCMRTFVSDNCGLSWDGITYGYGKDKPCTL